MSEIFDVRQEIPGFVSLPGNVPDINQTIRDKLARVILDDTITLVAHSRGNSVTYDNLTDQQFAELYKPLIEVLQLDPTKDAPPTRAQIDRASILGLVPSQKAIYARTTLSKVQALNGFRPKYRFQDWLKSDYIEAGQKLATIIGGRPKRVIIDAASKGLYSQLGNFPTTDEIKCRFGSLSAFQELCGYPSCRSWEVEDYLDWSNAFYRQNPDVDITPRMVGLLSIRGVGPSTKAIYNNFGSFVEFKKQASTYFGDTINNEAWERSQRYAHAKRMSAREPLMNNLLTSVESNERRILQVAAQFMILECMMPDIDDNTRHSLASKEEASAFVRSCVGQSRGEIKAADVEIQALQLGVYDDLWPMYRFENVDLKIRD